MVLQSSLNAARALANLDLARTPHPPSLLLPPSQAKVKVTAAIVLCQRCPLKRSTLIVQTPLQALAFQDLRQSFTSSAQPVQ